MELEEIILFETAIDHLTGEEVGLALEELNNMPNVLDALFLQGIGKKNRPAGLLQVMCRPDSEFLVRDAIFKHTHVLGIRRQTITRYVLERSPSTVQIQGETIPAKEHILENTAYLRPEADGIHELATRLNLGVPGLRFRKNLN